MIMCVFWGVYLITFIQILPHSAFLEYFIILGFGGNFWVFKIFNKKIGMRMGDFGGIFSNFYSDFASFCLNYVSVCQVGLLCLPNVFPHASLGLRPSTLHLGLINCLKLLQRTIWWCCYGSCSVFRRYLAGVWCCMHLYL